MIQREIQHFQASLMFFTRIPGVSWAEYPKEAFSQASRYFPLVGWFVGIIGAGVFWGGSLVFPPSLAILLSMIATILLTGALHEDGLADFCDGLGGGWTKEQVLDIMKDSYIGVFGVLGLFLTLGLKLLTLLSLPKAIVPLILVSGHSLSRFASISFMYTHDYVREDDSSKTRPIVRRMSMGELLLTGIIGMFPFFFMSLLLSRLEMFGIGILTVGLTRGILGYHLSQRLQGYTGDCLGAVQQITEIVLYLSLVPFW